MINLKVACVQTVISKMTDVSCKLSNELLRNCPRAHWVWIDPHCLLSPAV